MKKINLYECHEDGRFIGVATAKEWEQRLGINSYRVWDYASDKRKYKKRYTFHKVKGEEKTATIVREGWCEEWDAACEKLRGKRG